MSSLQPGINISSQIWLLLAVCLAALSMPLSFTGPALALPVIRQTFGGSPLELNWITNAFMLSFGGTLMVAGAIADSYGRRRVFFAGLLTIIVSVLAMATTSNMLCFNLLRGVQGLGCAMALAAGSAALAQVFDGGTRTRAFSLLGTSFGIGLAFGPVISGWLVEHLGWRGMVLAVGVLALVSLIASVRHMPESRNPHTTGLDLPGAITFTVALSLFTLAVLQAPASGWRHPLVLAALAGALVVGGFFVMIECRRRHPMLDLSLFRIPRFIGVQCLAAAPAYAYVVLLVLLPIRFTGLEGHDAVQAGQLMMLLSAPMLVVPALAALLTRWVLPRWICVFGLLLCALGLFWLSGYGIGSPAYTIAWPMLLIGIGIGLPWGLMDGMAVSVVPRERAGMATGIFGTVRVAGEGVALALVSAVLTALVARQLGGSAIDHSSVLQIAQYLTTGALHQALLQVDGLTVATLLQAYDVAFAILLKILAGMTLMTAGVVMLFLRESSQAEAE